MAGAGRRRRGTRSRGGAGLGAIRAGTSMGSAASTAYKLGQETSGSTSVGAGLGGVCDRHARRGCQPDERRSRR